MTRSLMLPHDWFPRPLPPNVVVGERSWIYSSYAFLHYQSTQPCGVRIGHDTGAYIETFFDIGPDGQVEIGSYCTLAGPVISTNGRVVIGNYVFISREVVIADESAQLPGGTQRASDARLVSTAGRPSITIGDDAWIGSRAVLLNGAHLGDGAIVAAAAVVDFEVPPYAVVAGNPARTVGWARPKGRIGG